MRDIIKSVISAGGYKLADIQYKIKKLYIMGDLTEEEMDELLILASGCVSVDAERPEVLTMVQTLAADVAELKAAVKALTGGTDTDDGDYPEWEPWNGINDNYQPGAIVSHNVQLWQSTYPGQNVWEPGTVGDDFWVKYQE